MNPFDDAEVISTYSRAEAIEDGELVDVTDRARELGFKIPVALTRAVFEDCVAWDGPASQDEPGRLHDVLWMCYLAVRRVVGDRVAFELLRVPRDSQALVPVGVILEAVCGPGDDARPVITIQHPGED